MAGVWLMSPGAEGLLPTCACLAYGLGFFLLFIYVCISWPAPPTPEIRVPLLDARMLRPVVLVTIAWNALYFCFLQGQAAAAFWIHKQLREVGSKKDDESVAQSRLSGKPIEFADVKYGPAKPHRGLVLTMDRTVGNMLEQSLPFLLSLWLNALTGSPHDASWYGWIWLLLRATYPVGFAHPDMTPALWCVQRKLGISWVSLITWPSYCIVWLLLYKSAVACY